VVGDLDNKDLMIAEASKAESCASVTLVVSLSQGLNLV